jgi:ribonuclease HI
MNVPFGRIPGPHFRLHSEALAGVQAGTGPAGTGPAGRWRFVLRSTDGRTCLEAEDDEPETSTERLELLAIVRALESLDEPARVTLVAPGRSISRGIRYGVAQWRENDWQWERYGKLTPVKNGDLWRRIDRAMSIHDVVCRDAPAGADDLAATPTRSVSDGSGEPADVRVIHRTHRGRRLRIDGVGQASRPPIAHQRPTRSHSPLRRCLRALTRLVGGLVPGRSVVLDH